MKKAADLGNVEAMYKYGLMLKSDKGITVDKKETDQYFKLAADRDLINDERWSWNSCWRERSSKISKLHLIKNTLNSSNIRLLFNENDLSQKLNNTYMEGNQFLFKYYFWFDFFFQNIEMNFEYD